MSSQADIRAVITADDRASGVLSAFADRAAKAGKDIGDGLKDAAKGVAAVGVGLTAYAKNATDFTEDYVKSSKSLARVIGETTEESSRLLAATQRLGLSAEQATQVFGIFSKNITSATEDSIKNKQAQQDLALQIEGTKRQLADVNEEMRKNGDKSGDLAFKAKTLTQKINDLNTELTQNSNAFDKLGISTVDASGKQKDFEAVLFEVADKFKAMPDGIDKTTLSMQLFGRSGKDMIKVLDLGSSGIQDLEKQADKLGLTLNANTITRVNALVQSQKNLKEQTDTMKISVGTATAPILTAFNKTLNDVVANLISTDSPFRALTTNILAFGGPAATATASLVGFVSNITQMPGNLLRAGVGLTAFGGIMAGLFVIFERTTNGTIDLRRVLEGLKIKILEVGHEVSDYLSPKIEALWHTLSERLIPAMLDLWHNVIEPLMPILGTALVVAFGAVVDIANALITALSGVTNFMVNHGPEIITFAAVFGTLAIAMNFGAIVGAFNVAMNSAIVTMETMRLVTLPNLAATLTTFGAFGVFAAAAGIALDTVYNKGQRTLDLMDRLNGQTANILNSQSAAEQQIFQLLKSGTPEQKARAKQSLHTLGVPGYATGTNYAPGGLAMVGENGPELVNLPRGSQVVPNSQMSAGGTTQINVTVQAQAFLGNQNEARKFAQQIFNTLQDIAASKNTTVAGMVGAS